MRYGWQVIYWGSAMLLVVLPVFLLYLLALPFLALFWLTTHQLVFQFIRVLFVLSAGLFLFGSLAHGLGAALASFVLFLVLVWLCFSEKRYRQFTALHRPFPRPPAYIGRVMGELLPARLAIQAAADSQAPVASHVPVEESIYIARVSAPPPGATGGHQMEDGTQ